MAVLREHIVRFEEVDAARIVFYGRFPYWCHESMERFFDPIGYSDLILNRRIGFPAVHLDANFTSPLRYGDVVQIETSISKVGTTSATFQFVFTNKATGAHVATFHHVVACVDLETVTKQPLPDDVRALLEAHRTYP